VVITRGTARGVRTGVAVLAVLVLAAAASACTGNSVTGPGGSVTASSGAVTSVGTGTTATQAGSGTAGISVTGTDLVTGTGTVSGTGTATGISVPTAPTSPSGTAPALSTTPVPVTPDGLATGPGVTTSTITLGLLVDPGLDRGFTSGVALWQHTLNTNGGVCGRMVEFTVAGQRDIPSDLASAYLTMGRRVLGLITLAADQDRWVLAELAGGDGVPALTPSGTSEQLRRRGPVVIGPTVDILAINALDYLVGTDLAPEDRVGVLTNGSATAQDELSGLAWQAAQTGIQLEVHSTDEDVSWDGVAAVVSLAGPAETERLLTVPAGLTVITTVDGFDPALVSDADSSRLLVVMPTPAFDSDHPGWTAVATAFQREGATDPGPRVLAGYATAATWGRVLAEACADLALTRTGVNAALAAIGPAPVDGLLGPADPGLVVTQHLPATRLSAIAVADPTAPTGLRGLTWLQAAGDIGDYTPGG
jgi:ABC-type branched-subunit amino acid transport system substrate-binding protein